MKDTSVFVWALNSLFRHQNFKEFLIDDNKENKDNLEAIDFLSKIHSKIAFINGMLILFSISLFAASGVSIFIANHFLGLNIGNNFFYILNGLSVGLFFLTLLVRILIGNLKKVLIKGIIKGYKTRNIYDYTTYFGKGEHQYFLVDDDYIEVPVNKIEVLVKETKDMLDSSFNANGKLVNVVNNTTGEEFVIQLEIVG
ncbi:hypothetical protein [Companilactobacillus muriivasis]|uniref:hypothetical protein n=1 Tax=Companilactobacillus muriivasis TaxID=3081444 RepID=UPI0030C6BB98